MRFVLGSIFRNSVNYIPRYVSQVTDLREKLLARGDSLLLILAEGDNTDDTSSMLRSANTWRDWKGFPGGVIVMTREHRGPLFGSVDDDTRWRQSSWVWEGVIERVSQLDDVFCYVESDLIWDSDTLLRLAGRLGDGKDVVCPLCLYAPENMRHYDSWGLRGLDGKGFGPFWPYHSSLLQPSPDAGMFPINSAGSCLVMRAEVARRSRFIPDNLAVVGWCQNMRENGFKLWLDDKEKVVHP